MIGQSTAKNSTELRREIGPEVKHQFLSHHSFFRRLSFPPGTFLIFEPEISLPTWRDRIISRKKDAMERQFPTCGGFETREALDLIEDEDIAAIKNSDIQIISPFYVYFDRLGWTHEDSIYNVHNRVGPYFQEYLINPALNIFGVPPPPSLSGKSRQDSESMLKSDKRRMSISDSHRLTIFTKIEELLEEIGVHNGKACLLRAICELHEFPFEGGKFGLFGEVLALILGTLPKENNAVGSTQPCLSIYAKAEISGRRKNCLPYAKHCGHSIFQWYWKS